MSSSEVCLCIVDREIENKASRWNLHASLCAAPVIPSIVSNRLLRFFSWVGILKSLREKSNDNDGS